jgi:hypothetical protein
MSKLETDFWIEIKNTYRALIAERQALFAQHGPDVLQYLPGSELACKELMEMAIQLVYARYPQYFQLSDDRTILFNRILHTTSNLKEEPPLIVLLNHIPEDFAIMLRNPENGEYYFRAGIICSAIGWNLASKMGLGLSDIHKVVPDYKEKMQMSMDRYGSPIYMSAEVSRYLLSNRCLDSSLRCR